MIGCGTLESIETVVMCLERKVKGREEEDASELSPLSLFSLSPGIFRMLFRACFLAYLVTALPLLRCGRFTLDKPSSYIE